MSIRRFYSIHEIINNFIQISGDEFHHLKNVNRAAPGDHIEVINGLGSLFKGEVIELGHKSAQIRILETATVKSTDKPIIIAPSLLKRKNMNLLIEKLAEIGIDEIHPVIFSRTDERYFGSEVGKWEKIALQALKVNKKLWKTRIFAPVSVAELLRNSLDINTKFLLDIQGRQRIPVSVSRPVLAVIGPPGDITEKEREVFKDTGFSSININSCTLKSETAAISMAALLKNIL